MASDLKLEIFAFNLFHNLWHTYGVTEILPDVLEVYEDECSKVNDFIEALEIQFDPIIFVRHSLFKNIYRQVLTDELIERLKSPLDCYNYVLRICDRDEFFDHLTVFQRMFATITFVLILCLHMHESGRNIDIVKYGHMFWVMYFDKFTEEFYENGGWKTLQMEVKPYEDLFDFDHAFNKCIFKLQKIKQATVNYFLSKYAVQCEEQKHEHTTHFSKLWIKFCTTHLERYVNIPLSYEIYMNPFDAELLLEDLKLILFRLRDTPSNFKIEKGKHQASTIPTSISLSELSYALEETKANDTGAISFSELHYAIEETKDNDTGVQPITFQQTRIINKVPGEFLAIKSDLKKRTGTKCAISEQEVLNLDITIKNENLKFEKDTLTEMESSKQTSSLNSTKNSHTEQNLLPAIDRKKQPDTSTENSPNAADSGHIYKSKSFINKCEDGKAVNVCKENIERQDKIAATGHKMVENISAEKVSNLNDSSPARENVSSDGERENTIKTREDLRNEQKDPDMKYFLKMLLILDNKEETKSVLSKLQNNAGDPENSQKISKKKKKRSKKKSGK